MANIFSKLRGLIPTARVDKNGRVVIRHMKPEEMGAGEPKTPIPPPQNSRPVASEHLVMDTMNFLADATELDHYDYGPGMEMMGKQIRDLLPSTLQRIMALENADEGQVAFAIYGEFHEDKINEAYINDLAQLSSHVGQYPIDVDDAASYIRGLQRYEALCPMGEDGSYPEERYSQCVTLLDTAYRIRNRIKAGEMDEGELDFKQKFPNPLKEPMITNERLVAFILNAKDTEREKVAAIVGERGITNPDDIVALMGASDAASLSNGAL